jgi:hypothetical protein
VDFYIVYDIIRDFMLICAIQEQNMLKNRFILKSIVTIVVCFVASMMFLSCEKSTGKQITAFSFTQSPAVGEIHEVNKTIAVEVPAGIDVTTLVPVIVYSPMKKIILLKQRQV